MKHKKQSMGNAYKPAAMGRNGGAMGNKKPPRKNNVEAGLHKCKNCNSYLDVEDDSIFCADCEE